ncbi:hypothetical protein ZTR_08089 [Talaromyces verruculosus]|nr:hypothetical protein ZTR_08089 [Talaromyces verruculosus]
MSSNHPSKESEPTNQNTQPSSENTTTTTTTTATTRNQDKGKEPSLLSRIQNSASSLLQDSLRKPSGATLSSELAHVLDSGNKGSSSSASFSGLTHSGQTWRTNGLGNGSSSSAAGHQDGYTSELSEGFRSSQPSGRAFDASEFDSFQNTRGFFHTQEQNEFIPETSDSNKGKGKGKSRDHPLPKTVYDNNLDFEHGQDMMMIPDMDINEYESSYFNAYEMAWINASRLGTVYRSTASTPSKRLSQSSQSDINPSILQTQSKNENGDDGAEVVNLLADPSFQPGLVTWDDNQHYDDRDTTSSGLGFDLAFNDNDPLDAESFPHALAMSLSPTEMQVLDSFRRQQPYYQQHQTDQSQEGKKKITAYSLVPDIDSFLSQYDTRKTDDDALRNEVITNLIGAEEWLTVDERYNDDVWGYLRPAVEAAAAEIKEKEENPAREGDGDGDGPAVKRLKMILRHMARL